jgi:hypothetical protein
MNADVTIRASLLCSYRSDEPFKPTITYTHAGSLETDIDHYRTTVPGFVVSLWDIVVIERGLLPYRNIDLHVSVTVDNVTHPPTAAGVVKLPKAHRDFHLTDLEIVGVAPITEAISKVIDELKGQTGY